MFFDMRRMWFQYENRLLFVIKKFVAMFYSCGDSIREKEESLEKEVFHNFMFMDVKCPYKYPFIWSFQTITLYVPSKCPLFCVLSLCLSWFCWQFLTVSWLCYQLPKLTASFESIGNCHINLITQLQDVNHARLSTKLVLISTIFNSISELPIWPLDIRMYSRVFIQ